MKRVAASRDVYSPLPVDPQGFPLGQKIQPTPTHTTRIKDAHERAVFLGLSKNPNNLLTGASLFGAANKRQKQDGPAEKEAIGYNRQAQQTGWQGLMRAIRQTTDPASGAPTRLGDGNSMNVFDHFSVGPPSLPLQRKSLIGKLNPNHYTNEDVQGSGTAGTNHALVRSCRLDPRPLQAGVIWDGKRPLGASPALSSTMIQQILSEGTLLFRIRDVNQAVVQWRNSGLVDKGQALVSLGKLNSLLASDKGQQILNTADAVHSFCSFHGAALSVDVFASGNTHSSASYCQVNYTARGSCRVTNLWGQSPVTLVAGMHLWLVLRKVPADHERDSLRFTQASAIRWRETHATVQWYYQFFPVALDSDRYPHDLVESHDGEHGMAVRVGLVAKEPQIDPEVARAYWATFARFSNTYYGSSTSNGIMRQANQFPKLEIHLGV